VLKRLWFLAISSFILLVALALLAMWLTGVSYADTLNACIFPRSKKFFDFWLDLRSARSETALVTGAFFGNSLKFEQGIIFEEQGSFQRHQGINQSYQGIAAKVV
jgi:hypothetical protein